MRRRPLGKTGIEVTELALGTWGLSGDAYGPVPPEQAESVITRASELGVTTFETADIYGDGEMERRLGQLAPKDAVIITKIGTDRWSKPDRKRFDAGYLDRALDASSERLGTPPTVVLLHNPSQQMFQDESGIEFLRRAGETDRLGTWGLSVGNAAVGRAALERDAPVVSLTHNVFASETLLELSPLIQLKGTAVLAHSVLAFGLLCGHWARDRLFPPSDHRSMRWTPDQLRRRISQLDAIRSIVGGPVVSLRAAAVRYALASEAVSSAVLGPRSAFQLDQLVREAGREPPYLDDTRRIKLETRLADVGVRS